MKRKLLLSTVIWLTLTLPCTAAFIEVPDDFPTIGGALDSSAHGDTILVHPGVYPERLILPGHDFLLVSEFYFNQDSSALYNTIIDASDFAEEDTASVLTFMNGNSRATVVSGFTLRGGHGVVDTLWPPGMNSFGGCVYISHSHPTILSNIITENESVTFVAIHAMFSHPRIAHNLIYDNCGNSGVFGLWYYSDLDEMAVIEWNDLSQNWGCYEPEWPYLSGSITSVEYCGAVIRFNRFHDYYGNFSLGASFHNAWGELLGNSFENLTYVHFEGTQDEGMVVMLYHSRVSVRDNIFRDCSVDEPALFIVNLPLQPPRQIERNWFENVRNTGTAGAAGANIIEPSGTIRENVFIGCVSNALGALGLSSYTSGSQGCRATIEGNHFFANRSLNEEEYRYGSAISASGYGSSLCTVRNNWFEGNESIAIDLEHLPNPLDWDCTNNYWGDPTGPYHPTLNPEGRGDTVDINILFDPWLTEPPSGSGVGPSSPFALSPEDWQIEPPFPNPFNSTTQIRLISSRPQPFEVMVYNVLGRRVRQLWRGVVPKDAPVSITWDGRDERGQVASTGLYFIVAMSRLPASSHPKTVKALFLR